MPPGVVRTTLALPEEVLAAIDQAVRSGKARSRNEWMTNAARRELAAQRRAEIDADLAGMADDEEYKAEAEQIMKEFAGADWAAFQTAERHGVEDGHAAR